jgi:hypothetical protein
MGWRAVILAPMSRGPQKGGQQLRRTTMLKCVQTIKAALWKRGAVFYILLASTVIR